MSKVQQIQNFFNNNPTMDRKEMINIFVSQFQMTEKGAATYYSNAKRVFSGGSFHQTQPKDNIKVEEENDVEDNRTLYHVLTLKDNIIDAIHSFFSRPSKIKEGQLITTDDVDIGQTVDKLTLI